MLADLGWVDFDLSVPPILPSCPAASAKFPSAQAELGRQWNTQNSSQPNPVYEHMGRPVFARAFLCNDVDLGHPYTVCFLINHALINMQYCRSHLIRLSLVLAPERVMAQGRGHHEALHALGGRIRPPHLAHLDHVPVARPGMPDRIPRPGRTARGQRARAGVRRRGHGLRGQADPHCGPYLSGRTSSKLKYRGARLKWFRGFV